MATGSSSRNSKSTGSEPSDGSSVEDGFFEGSSSRLNEILGPNHPYDGNFSGDTPILLLTHAEAIFATHANRTVAGKLMQGSREREGGRNRRV